jgi:uncharacterized protein YdbL (DUF1318 family)
MRKLWIIGLLAALATLACIHVVVNVYFPESEAKGALATLEDELLKGSPAKAPAGQTEPPKGAPPAPPAGEKQSFLRFLKPQVAYAAGPVSEEDIYNRIKSMPQVVEAYQRIAARMPRVDALRASGLVGEGRDGLLKPRGEIQDRRDQRTIEEENADRQAVISGLARASLLAQNQPATQENINQVLPDAAATFAALRRDRAQPGWWVQTADGGWKQK